MTSPDTPTADAQQRPIVAAARNVFDAIQASSIPLGMTETSFHAWRSRQCALQAVPLAREVLRLHEPDDATVERVRDALRAAREAHHGTAATFCVCGWMPDSEPYVEATHHAWLDEQVADHQDGALVRAALAALTGAPDVGLDATDVVGR